MVASYDSAVRPITEEEIAAFNEQGWAKIPGLIDPALASEMLRAAKAEMSLQTDGPEPRDYGTWRGHPKLSPTVVNINSWYDRRWLLRDKVEPFRSLLFSRPFGVNAQRLTDDQAPVRYHVDFLACKQPVGSAGSEAGGWHQDMSILPFDRPSPPQWWIAMDEIEPAQGSVEFLTGSHREGLVSVRNIEDSDGSQPYDSNLALARPDLFEKYEVAPSQHLQPGDATIHHGYVLHRSPPNTSDKVRWTYIVVLIAEGTRYTGEPKLSTFDLGFQVGDPIEHENFPQLASMSPVEIR
jgi:hypothetical protein